MNDDVSEFDILVLTSAYQGRLCVVFCFLVLHLGKHGGGKAFSGVKRENTNI